MAWRGTHVASYQTNRTETTEVVVADNMHPRHVRVAHTPPLHRDTHTPLLLAGWPHGLRPALVGQAGAPAAQPAGRRGKMPAQAMLRLPWLSAAPPHPRVHHLPGHPRGLLCTARCLAPPEHPHTCPSPANQTGQAPTSRPPGPRTKPAPPRPVGLAQLPRRPNPAAATSSCTHTPPAPGCDRMRAGTAAVTPCAAAAQRLLRQHAGTGRPRPPQAQHGRQAFTCGAAAGARWARRATWTLPGASAAATARPPCSARC